MIHYYGLDGTNKTFEQCLEEMKEEAIVNKDNKNEYINDYLKNYKLKYDTSLNHYKCEEDYNFEILGKDIKREYENQNGNTSEINTQINALVTK